MAVLDVAVTLSLRDNLTGPAKAAAQALKSLTDSVKQLSKAGGSTNGLVNSLNRLKADTTALRSGLKGLSSEFRQIASGAKAMSSAMSAGKANTGWAKQYAGQLKQIAAEQQSIIRGARQLRGGGGGGGHGGGLGVLPALGLGYGAHRAGHGIAEAFKGGGNLQNQMVSLKMLGLDSGTQKAAISQSEKLSSQIPQLTTADFLENFKEMRYAFGNTQHAFDSMQDLGKFMVALKGALPQEKFEQIKDQVYQTAKGAEMLGKINNTQDFKWWLDAMQRSALASGGVVDPNKMFSALKYARGATTGFGDDFTSKIMPELVQELSTGGRKGGGGRGGAGTALAAFKNFWVDGKGVLAHADALAEAGLLDPSKIVHNRRGKAIDMMPGAMQWDQKAAAQDPFKFIQDNIVGKALKKLGVDPNDKAAVTTALGKFGGTQTGQQLLNVISLYNKAMEARAQQQAMAMGVDKSYGEVIKQYNASLDGMKHSFENLSSHMSLPFMQPASDLFNKITSAQTKLKDFFVNNNDMISKVAPAMTASVGGLLAMMLPRILRSGLGRLGVGGAIGALTGDFTSGLLAASVLGGKGGGGAAQAAGAQAGATMLRAFAAGILRAVTAAGIVAMIGQLIDAKYPNGALDDKLLNPKEHKDKSKLGKALPGLRSWLREAAGIEDVPDGAVASKHDWMTAGGVFSKPNGGMSDYIIPGSNYNGPTQFRKSPSFGFGNYSGTRPFPAADSADGESWRPTDYHAETAKMGMGQAGQVSLGAGKVDSAALVDSVTNKAREALSTGLQTDAKINVNVSAGSVNTGNLAAEVKAKAQAAVQGITITAPVNVNTTTSGGGGGGGGGSGAKSAGGPSGGGSKMAGGGGNIHVASMQMHVHGAGAHPTQIADMVHQKMIRNARNSLSDHGFMVG